MIKSLPAALLTAALMVATAVPTAASANEWNRHHPARTEINHRIERQNHRIAMERREGELSRGEARDLHARDHGIRMQERADASRHDGHLNRYEAHRLNRELNGNSGEIGR